MDTGTREPNEGEQNGEDEGEQSEEDHKYYWFVLEVCAYVFLWIGVWETITIVMNRTVHPNSNLALGIYFTMAFFAFASLTWLFLHDRVMSPP